MKKRIVVFLASLMCISLCTCGTESTVRLHAYKSCAFENILSNIKVGVTEVHYMVMEGADAKY